MAKRYSRAHDAETVFVNPPPRMADRPSAEALIKSKPGSKCEYFGDVVKGDEFTATCKASELDSALKSLCGKKVYTVIRVKELVNQEVAVRVRLGEESEGRLIS